MKIRDKAIITGLYLSKYSKVGLKESGFASFQEAFNILGFSLGIKPNSIKNYRDEFDPLFPNNRMGWHNRPIRDYCKYFYDEFFNEYLVIKKGFYSDCNWKNPDEKFWEVQHAWDLINPL